MRCKTAKDCIHTSRYQIHTRPPKSLIYTIPILYNCRFISIIATICLKFEVHICTLLFYLLYPLCFHLQKMHLYSSLCFLNILSHRKNVSHILPRPFLPALLENVAAAWFDFANAFTLVFFFSNSHQYSRLVNQLNLFPIELQIYVNLVNS